MRFMYSFIGAIIGVLVDLFVNLLAAAIQNRSIDDQFQKVDIMWLGALIVVGILLGLWLATPLELHPKIDEQKRSKAPTKSIKMTRLIALLSYTKLRGQGIELSDIFIVGSVIDIEK